METQSKEKKKLSKKINNPKRDKLESIINENIKSIDNSRHFFKFIMEISKDFIKISESFNNKLQILLSKFSPEELAKKKINNEDDINIAKFFKDIIKIVNNKINNMIKNLTDYISPIYKEFEKASKIESTLNSKKQEFLNNYLKQALEIETMNLQYFKEFNNYEDYLTHKYVSLKNKNKEIKDDKDNKELNNTNNIKEIKDIQDKLMKYIEISNNSIKENLKYFNDEKFSNQGKIYDYCIFFINCICQGLSKEQDFTDELNNINKYLDIFNNSKKVSNKNIEESEEFLFKIVQYSLKSIPNKEKEYTYKDINEKRLLKSLSYQKIYNIIDEIRNNELLMSKEDIIKCDEIKKIIVIQKFIDSLFDEKYGENNIEGTKPGKDNQMISTIKDYFNLGNIYRLEFIQYLNNKRVDGKLCLNKKASEILGDLLLSLNKYSIKEKDYALFKVLSILSITYYYIENNEKIFICKYLKNYSEFNNKQFWIDYLKSIIDDELKEEKELEKSISDFSYKELKNLKSTKVHTSIYSNIFSLVKIMIDFGLKKDFLIEWLNIVVNNILYIEENEKKDIINLINEEQS